MGDLAWHRWYRIRVDNVLVSARTGLIFTRRQEETQPGRLIQTGQTSGIFDTMCCHVQFWVGEMRRGKLNAAREHAGHRAMRVALCISLFVFYVLLISVIVATVHSICCWVKPPLSWLTSFDFFFPFLLSTSMRRGVIEWPRGPLLPARAKPWHFAVVLFILTDSLTFSEHPKSDTGAKFSWDSPIPMHHKFLTASLYFSWSRLCRSLLTCNNGFLH